MRKWTMLLALALLCCASCGYAEEENMYYTNNEDIYYHTDLDCDRPESTTWYSGRERIIFDRECYRKYPISEEAALAFEKAACPICVKQLKPVYLGEYLPDWEGEKEPWELAGGYDSLTMELNPYNSECAETYTRFESYYEEVYDKDADSFNRKHPYPDFFAGVWKNCSGGCSYAVVDPTQEITDLFKRMFGGGAWIVPAKYGYNEMKDVRPSIFDTVEAWCENHPEFDIIPVAVTMDADANCLRISIYGDDWEEAMPVLDAELGLPVWVCFCRWTELPHAA